MIFGCATCYSCEASPNKSFGSNFVCRKWYLKRDSCAKIVFVFNTTIFGGVFLLNGFWRECHRKDGCLCALMIGKSAGVCRKPRGRLHVIS